MKGLLIILILIFFISCKSSVESTRQKKSTSDLEPTPTPVPTSTPTIIEERAATAQFYNEFGYGASSTPFKSQSRLKIDSQVLLNSL